LSAVGEFYFGGKDGFLTDTIGSLVYMYFFVGTLVHPPISPELHSSVRRP
jgi:hypothetical protein